MLTPAKFKMLPASTVPAVLAGAEISRTSSMPPTRYTTTAARITPTGTVGASKTCS